MNWKHDACSWPRVLRRSKRNHGCMSKAAAAAAAVAVVEAPGRGGGSAQRRSEHVKNNEEGKARGDPEDY